MTAAVHRRPAVDEVVTTDVVVVGGGVAGLTAAIGLADRRVSLFAKGRPARDGSSVLAQGGVAAALGPADSPSLHAADTLAVSGGLGDPVVVRLLASEGPRQIRRLAANGAKFDRAADGGIALGREAAHSEPRIVHAGGDATGAELVRTLGQALDAADNVRIHAGATVLEIAVERGRAVGVVALHEDGRTVLHLASAVVLATGGVGGLYARTTNPRSSTGDGLAMAARAGAELVDLEFVQFHPTAIDVGADPMPLATEALRGAGAVLIDETARRFMTSIHPDAELAPRDIVARGLASQHVAGHRTFLDATAAVGDEFPRRFPTVWAACRRHGLDPRVEPIPVAPAAHYHMGGVATDAGGRSNVPGLWACGEVASTGAHGANRLASNSLLEGLVFGARVAEDIADSAEPAPVMGLVRPLGPAGHAGVPGALLESLRTIMARDVGVVRDGEGMTRAAGELAELAEQAATEGDIATVNAVTAARMIVQAALARRESRGAHHRRDLPESDPQWRRRLLVRLGPSGEAEIERGPLLESAGAVLEGGAD